MAAKQSHYHSQPEDPKRKVLAHYFSLQSSLQLASNQSFPNVYSAEFLANNNSTVTADIDAIAEFLSTQLDSAYYNDCRLPDSTKAAEVFQLPELLEMIVRHTDFIDILHMSATCHSIKDRIYGSPELQVRLFLKESPRSDDMKIDSHAPFFKVDRLQYYYAGYSVTFKPIVDKVSINSDLDRLGPHESDEKRRACRTRYRGFVSKRAAPNTLCLGSVKVGAT